MIKQGLLTILSSLLLLTLHVPALGQDMADREAPYSIVIDQAGITLPDPIIMKDNRLFVPVSHLISYLGGDIEWNSDSRTVAIVTLLEDRILFTIDDRIMKLNDAEYVMDVEPFIHNERTYIPLRHAAEYMHARVEWDQVTQTAILTTIPIYTLIEGDSLIRVAERFGTTEQLLIERNGLTSSVIAPGVTLRIIIPEVMTSQHEWADEPSEDVTAGEDYLLMAKIIQVEAGYESYEAQLAVGNVIMNRVKDDRFPDTIREVIYQRGQFPPAHNGLLDKSVPNDSVLKAAEAVLTGENNIEDALYFYNPNVTSGKYWESLTLIKEIGGHRFVK